MLNLKDQNKKKKLQKNRMNKTPKESRVLMLQLKYPMKSQKLIIHMQKKKLIWKEEITMLTVKIVMKNSNQCRKDHNKKSENKKLNKRLNNSQFNNNQFNNNQYRKKLNLAIMLLQ